MGNLKLLFPFILLFLLSSCGQFAPEVLEQRHQPNEKTSRTELEGELNLINGQTLDLKQIQKTSILFFISESCTSCIEETKQLVALFQAKGLPKNIQIFSILIGSTQPDTVEWAQNYLVSWSVGFDEGLSLYKKYFRSLMTPSIVVYRPADEKVLLSQGIKSIEDLQKETGPWEY